MCGRFTLTIDPADLQEAFPDFIFTAQTSPRFNIAPSQPVLAIPNDGQKHAEILLWGLIPSWAKDAAIANRLINARSETLDQKPSFRGGFKYKRCLILADGFYEWKSQPGNKIKVPHFIHLKSRQPFAFAGLWDAWQSADGSLIKSCVIITTEPNELMAPIHNRMPVILRKLDYAQWIDPAPRTPASLLHLLKPYPADEMNAHPVSTSVNSPKNDRPECVTPL